ncbi:sigma-70 family RNA polymerase sigma factor [Anditalea andensis]|uniref:hypothetical protein n=1 Tax=Anditalea andensis TaxID=1048983 RepID=UPI0013DFDEFA|nr:hypothetical protein [Anditalea andensis]
MSLCFLNPYIFDEFKGIYNAPYQRLCQVAFKVLKDEEEAREVVQQVIYLSFLTSIFG